MNTIFRDKALGIKLKVIQLKHRNIKIIITTSKIIMVMKYDVKISHVMFRVYSVV
jgi:hypothetical protein